MCYNIDINVTNLMNHQSIRGGFMHIEYLKYFYEVASMRSISKAANNAHISQPALSQQIQRLEENLGHKLLIRSNKGVELTEAGRIVEKYARNLIKSYDNMVEDLNAIMNNNSTIRINSGLTLGTYALPCTLYSVQEKFSKFIFNLSSSPSDEVEQNIINDVYDVGFIYGKPKEEGLAYTKVGMDRLVVIASADFSIKQEVYLKDLLDHRLIMLDEKFRERRQLDEHLKRLGYKLSDFNISLSLDSTESVKATVVKGYGLSFVPYIAVKKELYTKQLKEIYVQDFEMHCDIYLIYKKEKDMSKSIKSFIQYLKKIGEKSFC